MAVSESSFEPKPFGRYVLLNKLAVGGMAEIYKAKTYGVDGFEKVLAVKRILPHCAADREFINMLVDEAKLTVLLSHANIVQVYDLGKVGDDYFISMEYIYGTNLREFINRYTEQTEKIPEEMGVYIISEMCKGLDYAHRKTDSQGNPLNIVHRDISPQNILISYEGEVKIVDFGIAKAAMNVSHTMAGILKGKVAYMSPEQALGKPIDHRTDIFSAGVVLYEMLTGEKLFTGETQFEVLNQIRTTRVNTLMLPDHIPGPLKAILAKALAYNVKDRYQSAGDFQLDLTKYLYSSYVDFSPRHLSSLMGKLFQNEIKRKEAPVVIDEKTSSAIMQQAKLEDIVVHRKEIEKKSTKKTVEAITDAVPAEPTERKKRNSLVALAAGGILVTLLVGYFSYHFISKETPSKPISSVPKNPEQPIGEFGSITVESTPEGAKIYLNSNDTGLLTPATLNRLAVGDDYQIKLIKENFRESVKTLALTSTQPVRIQQTLQPLSKGIIEIDSNPRGAHIFINGVDSGKATPSRIENLEIPKTYTLKLNLPNYFDWSSAVEIKNIDPVKLQATLTPTPVPQPILTQPQPQPQNPPAPQPQPEPTKTYGKLKLTSQPSGAKIIINGENSGKTTPSTLEKLESGRKVTVTLAKEGYKDWVRTITIEGNKVSSLTGTLKEVERVKQTIPSPEPASTGSPGSLSVNSEPSGADVYINSELKGTTPIKVTNVPSGNVRLIVSKEGFLKYTSTIKLGTGENKSLGTINLGGLYGEVSIASTPPRGTIVFDGEQIGARTPVTIRRVPRDKPHTLKIQLDGFRSWETTVNLQDQEKKKYDVVLEKD